MYQSQQEFYFPISLEIVNIKALLEVFNKISRFDTKSQIFLFNFVV